MELWKFEDYVSSIGTRPIAKWLKSLSAQDRSTLRDLLLLMSRQNEWSSVDYGGYSGNQFKGINKIRWKGEQKTPLRLMGYKRADSFVFLIGYSHKQNIYSPSSALATGVERKKFLDNKTATTCEHFDD